MQRRQIRVRDDKLKERVKSEVRYQVGQQEGIVRYGAVVKMVTATRQLYQFNGRELQPFNLTTPVRLRYRVCYTMLCFAMLYGLELIIIYIQSLNHIIYIYIYIYNHSPKRESSKINQIKPDKIREDQRRSKIENIKSYNLSMIINNYVQQQP